MWAGCQHDQVSDEDLLWSYYQGFTYPPQLFDSLQKVASSPETRNFLEGLRCFEKFSQFDNLECYDSARMYFSEIRRSKPDSYLSYLGLGLLLTEKAMNNGDSASVMDFARAGRYYDSARSKARDHAAICYYAARNLYNSDKSVFRRRVIDLLDTATQIRPGFAKALERQAEYLSHYLDLESTGKADSVRFFFPNIEIQIKHYFQESLKYDSSWFQTYAGIARSYRVYSTRERIDFLKKGLSIARRQKSNETVRLANSLADIYFYELADFETTLNARESISDSEGSYSNDKSNYIKLAWASFYHGESAAAADFFEKATAAAGGTKGAEAWTAYAQFYLLRARYDDAFAAAARAIAMNPADPLRPMMVQVQSRLYNGELSTARELLLKMKAFAEKQPEKKGVESEEYRKIRAMMEVIK